jgi:outer membrane protein assembly factor BamB
MFKLLIFFTVFTVSLALAQTNSKSTAMFCASKEHAGVYPSANTSSFGTLKWKFKTNGKIFSSPAVCNGVAYIGSEDHNLYAIDTKTGKNLWTFITGGAIDSSPTVYNNVVYFGSYDGYYYAVDAANGKMIWKFKTAEEKHFGFKGLWGMEPKDKYMEDQYDFYQSSPLLNLTNKELTIYFGSGDGNLYALNALNGKKKWAFKTNGIVHTSPAYYQGKIYFGSWDTYLYALDANTGQLKWKFKTKDHPVYHQLEGIQSSPTLYKGSVYFGCCDCYFYALDAATGRLKWKYDAKGSWVLTTAAVKDDILYISTSDTFLFIALDTKTGAEKYRFKANGYIYSSTALAGNTAYFGDFSGRLFALNMTDGKKSGTFDTGARMANAQKVLNRDNVDFGYLVKGLNPSAYATSEKVMDKMYTTGPIVSSPAINAGVIYFGSADGYLYALTLK